MQKRHGDNPRSVTKSKELEVHQALRDAQITFEYQHYLPFRGCGLESETAHAFADFALPTPWGYVLLEVDEEQHKVYDPSCDVRRGAWQRAQAAGAALQPGRLQDRRRDAADHQEGAPRAADPPAGRAVGARAGGAFHPPLSLLRPGRGEQRAALRGRALVRARARRVTLRLESQNSKPGRAASPGEMPYLRHRSRSFSGVFRAIRAASLGA